MKTVFTLLLFLLASTACGAGKTAHITGFIDENSATKFLMEMATTSRLPGDRRIIIDSPGGSVEAGIIMLAAIKQEQEKGIKVTCEVVHEASSMAFNILSFCDVKVPHKKTIFLVHKVAASVYTLQGQRLTARTLKSLAKELDKVDEPFRRRNAAAMHLNLNTYDFMADMETVWTEKSLCHLGYFDYSQCR